MDNSTPFSDANPPHIATDGSGRCRYGQLPERAIAAVCDLKLWGIYAYLDLLAGRSGWLRSTCIDLARTTDRSAGTFGERAAALGAADLIMIEISGRSRIFRTARRRGERYGRLPQCVVDATGRAELWGLYAWLSLGAGPGEDSIRLSYRDAAAELRLNRARVNRLMLDLAALGLVSLAGHGDSRLIALPDAGRAGRAARQNHTLGQRPSAVAASPATLTPVALDLPPDRPANERVSERIPLGTLSRPRSHTITPLPDLNRHPLRDTTSDADTIRICVRTWEDALGPLPPGTTDAIGRYVRTGRGGAVLNAIGWASGRGVNRWGYVEEIIRTEGWLHPPPGRGGGAPALRSASEFAARRPGSAATPAPTGLVLRR